MGAECRLHDVLWVHAHLVVDGAQVQFGEERDAYHRNGELVFHRSIIEHVVTDTTTMIRLAS